MLNTPARKQVEILLGRDIPRMDSQLDDLSKQIEALAK